MASANGISGRLGKYDEVLSAVMCKCSFLSQSCHHNPFVWFNVIFLRESRWGRQHVNFISNQFIFSQSWRFIWKDCVLSDKLRHVEFGPCSDKTNSSKMAKMSTKQAIFCNSFLLLNSALNYGQIKNILTSSWSSKRHFKIFLSATISFQCETAEFRVGYPAHYTVVKIVNC